MKKPMKKPMKKADGGMAYTGGTKNFNEETGQYFGYNKEPKPPIQPRRPERPSSWSYGDQKPPIQPRRPERPIAGFAGRGQGLMNAMKNANANARFKRDDVEDKARKPIRRMPPVVTPGGGGGTGPIMRPSVKMPMRKAKGGMAKGSKKK